MEVPPLDIWEGHQLIASDSPIGNVLAKLKELVVWECGQWMNISLLNRTSSGVRPKGLAGCQISADPTGASFLNYWWDLRISATLCFWVVFFPRISLFGSQWPRTYMAERIGCVQCAWLQCFFVWALIRCHRFHGCHLFWLVSPRPAYPIATRWQPKVDNHQVAKNDDTSSDPQGASDWQEQWKSVQFRDNMR